MKININAKPGSSRKNKTGSWRTFVPKIDKKKCISCGLCTRLCPDGAITMIEKDGKQIPQRNLNYCKGCGLCAKECPVKAIKMELEKK